MRMTAWTARARRAGSTGLQIPSIRNQRVRSHGRARAPTRAAPPGV